MNPAERSAADGEGPVRLGEAVISIGPDGRVYFHDLDSELIRLALALNPSDELMQRRLDLCSDLPRRGPGVCRRSSST